MKKATYGATYVLDDMLEMVITSVFPVCIDWDGHRFNGYCRPTPDEIRAAGYDYPVRVRAGSGE